ncbi:hypothetical protein COU78_04645 [Candidatus Peregrinibacteria bacterium CG10_big_fil_rev_8_21_14_0_10_49_24]|nr:MAG: hypothetical protein COV83_03790 [Candidatus Peregrinibacteria bacterium CG11_big_fil_rev_8_21_14_0_20_49_14]PIR50640.1 MAG: hypothetical protein COU78_04645 [Candidatus Peregrinibacteria bacterium CG10_big_fil_rev_8_21_14_0_10_49_24]PJA67724.1 MAG: hypothetical protein CO157_02935 [Candidatus Peregrinibacteria bacterium CG_4_9_14_3_um_filter_49_12]
MNILVLVAGTNEPSNSNVLADTFVQGMQQLGGVTVHKRRLKDFRIEHFSLDFYDPQCSQEEDFCALQALMQEADGLVIATPVWNFGVPAHLKNFIDRMGSFALDATRSRGTLNGMPFYMIYTGGAPYPAWKGLMEKTSSHIPEALKYFGASYMGHHFEGKCVKGQGKFGLVVDERPESIASVRKQGHAFASVVKKYKETGKAPIKQRTQGKIMKWGESVLKKVT